MTETTPAQREAEGVATTTIEWDGIEIEIPTDPGSMDVDALEAMENGKILTFLRHLMGSRRYDQVRKEWQKANGRKPTPNDLAPLMETVAEALGFETAGN